ncbi:RagB/SusD family nutrient uptake outer membrane protein [Niastella caeni]|uniref:RagB/SusD family nutrient uptake outer membrane protein n=1 Tax=Niastella caeni TaxID=2569763 RepID=A0A4S8HPL3_9BACT|nr:RagB/SusD family nutrient uptake outer membrane protein [Niastella caeni]THU35844.1 RagB/SusD family nutrient uptake outer membrane protein [Niastella caeni]
MKKLAVIISLFAMLFTGVSCKKNYLEVNEVKTYVSPDDLYTNYNYAQQAVWNVYSYLPDGFSLLDYEAVTENAEATNISWASHTFNNGIWNQYNNPDGSWWRNFNGIRQANLYLANKEKVNIEYIKGQITTSDSSAWFNARNNVKFMQGEVLFLKAFFYFDLVKRYAGVPIMNQPLNYDDAATWKNLPRNTVDECIKYIVALCDSAATIIPSNLSPYSWYSQGRVTSGAIKTLKAKALLYGASPLFREAGATATWADAADAFHEVIASNGYSLDANYANLFGANNGSSNELIFYRRYGNTNNVERGNFPIVFLNSDGNSITPTQNFVDQFEVLQKDNNGNITGARAFDWSNATDAENPYANRDPRMAATVVYNGVTFSSTAIETFRGGNSGLPMLNATKTGYYLSKWVNQSVNLVAGTSAAHTWIYFRYGQILLDYGEAMYNAYGATADPKNYGMTALQAVNLVRQRVQMPSLTAAQLNQQSIQHERNVELGFEDQRLWDVRRWKGGTTHLNKPVNRIEIIKNGSTYSYTVTKLENRVFEDKMNWYPVPQDEITKTGWAQNSGW